MADPGPRPHHAPSPPALAARLGHAASRSRSSARLLHSFPRPPAPLRASRRIMSIFLSSCSFRSHQSSACPPHAAGLPGWSFLNMSRKDPCQKQACEIQKCLQENNYLESKCEAVLQEMRKCCARYPKGRSVCCSGFEREEREREKVKLAAEGISPPPQ
ncbi:cx9C motif-containing protein 4 isoform X2 [Oenanthe melanoleuca]|uniref:cx9C motif-containing protein 4 isoform X2 n=1 Tax=Oenanthe melanoleuca TaxID=2939378 RepID=UPI0024C0F731|nr:cx9C motif-containing protein 4 isoform X2 [Oenanthe melanoleuca]